jgi:hypothetical protein
MKKIIALSLVASVTLFALDMNDIKGEIVLGGGIVKSNDRLSVHGSDDKYFNKDITTPIAMGNVQIGDFKLSFGEESLVKALYNINDDISIYVGYNTDEIWENPFVSKNTRKKTDINTIYGGINYQVLDWLEVAYRLQNQKVKSQTVHSDDKLSGNVHTLLANIVLPLSDDLFLINTVENDLGLFDGKGNDYISFGLSSGLSWQVFKNTTLEAEAHYKFYHFNNKMNHFNKKRDEKTYGSIALIEAPYVFSSLFLLK